jgi:hypothetical protein
VTAAVAALERHDTPEALLARAERSLLRAERLGRGVVAADDASP